MNLSQLRDLLVQIFSLAEFKLLCDDLQILHPELKLYFERSIPESSSYESQVHKVLQYLERLGPKAQGVQKLKLFAQEQRPWADWSKIEGQPDINNPLPHNYHELEAYLQAIIQECNTIQLPFISSDGGKISFPLQEIYVALKADSSSAVERKASYDFFQQLLIQDGQLLSEEVIYQMARQAPYAGRFFVYDPHRPQLDSDRQRLQAEKNYHLAELIRQHRWLVLLGDPGSGKSTLARWLALQLAQTLLNQQEQVTVLAAHIRPDGSDREWESLGGSRLPILVKLADYGAKRWQNGRDTKLTLLQYVGQKTSGGEALLHDYLTAGRATLLLDGLDEVTDVKEQRHEIVAEIERVIGRWVRNAAGLTPLDTPYQSLHHDTPAEATGNQILVTSRIVGYQIRPLYHALPHFVVQPMDDPAVTRFCHNWAKENPGLESYRDELVYGILENSNPHVKEQMGRNPLLLTMLCQIFRQNPAQGLPHRRADLYHQAQEAVFGQRQEAWQQFGGQLGNRDLTAVLGRVTGLIGYNLHAHPDFPNGLVDTKTITGWLKTAITQEPDLLQGRRVDDVAKAFLKAAVNLSGFLVQRGEGLFGFLHRQFQEYFSAIHLWGILQEEQERGETTTLLNKLHDPQWYEVLLLLVGWVEKEAPRQVEPLLKQWLTAPDPTAGLLLHNVLLVGRALVELSNPPAGVVRLIIPPLVEMYRPENAERLKGLKARIEAVTRQLPRTYGREGDVVGQSLKQMLLAAGEDETAMGGRTAVLEFIDQYQWYTPATASAVVKAWDWFAEPAPLLLYLFYEMLEQKPELFPASLFPDRQKLAPVWEEMGQNEVWREVLGWLYLRPGAEWAMENIFHNSPLTPGLLKLWHNQQREETQLKNWLENYLVNSHGVVLRDAQLAWLPFWEHLPNPSWPTSVLACWSINLNLTRVLDLDLARVLDRASVLDLDRYRTLNRALALDRVLDLARVLDLTLDRALALDLTLDRVLDRALDRARALNLTIDHARTLDLTLDLTRTLVLNRVRALDRALDLDFDRDFALDFDRARALDLDLARALDRDLTLDLAKIQQIKEAVNRSALPLTDQQQLQNKIQRLSYGLKIVNSLTQHLSFEQWQQQPRPVVGVTHLASFSATSLPDKLWPRLNGSLLLEKEKRQFPLLLKDWLTSPLTVEAQKGVLLLLLEGGVLSPEHWPLLAPLLDNSVDLYRYRSRRALAKYLRQPASDIGQPLLTLLAEQCTQAEDGLTRQRTYIHWGLTSIQHNEASWLQQWVQEEQIELLRRVHQLDPALWENWVEWLQHSSPSVQKALLQSTHWLFQLTNAEEIPDALVELLLQLAQHPDDSIRQEALTAVGYWPRPADFFPQLWELASQTTPSPALFMALMRVAVRVEDKRHLLLAWNFCKNQPHQPGAISAWLVGYIHSLIQAEKATEEKPFPTEQLTILWQTLAQVGVNLTGKQLLSFLLEAGSNDEMWGNIHEKICQFVHLLVDSEEGLLQQLVEALGTALAQDNWEATRLAVACVAECATTLPDALNQLERRMGVPVEEYLIHASQQTGSHNSRRYALTALSYLRELTPAVLTALLRSAYDVPQVQQDAVQAVARFRSLSPHFDQAEALAQFRAALHSESAAEAYLACQLLGALGRSPALVSAPTLRQHLASLLSEAYQTSPIEEIVYLLEGDKIVPQGSRGEAILQALQQVWWLPER